MARNILYLIALVTTFVVVREATGQCAVAGPQRKGCGWGGIDAATCTAKDCCYNELPGAPWCFYKQDDDRAEQCAVFGAERKACGWAGIDASTCTAKDCCYDEAVANAPWCFYQKDDDRVEKCAVAGAERKGCGVGGIDAETCTARGCCYDESIAQVAWCFYQKEDEESQQDQSPQVESPQVESDDDCTESCTDYHRICRAVKEAGFYDEYKALYDAGKLEMFGKAEMPPAVDCNNVFYQIACPQSCGACKACAAEAAAE